MTVDAEFEASARAGVAAVGRSAPARALVGPADLPRHLHEARPRARRPRRVPHDRARGRPAEGLLGRRRGRCRRIGSSFRDGFANDDGSPNTELPTSEMRVTIEEIGDGRTRMSIESVFPSTEAMEQVLAMGMEEGLTQAVGQIDAILAEDAGREPELTGRWRRRSQRPRSPLERLIGTWDFEPSVEGRFAGPWLHDVRVDRGRRLRPPARGRRARPRRRRRTGATTRRMPVTAVIGWDDYDRRDQRSCTQTRAASSGSTAMTLTDRGVDGLARCTRLPPAVHRHLPRRRRRAPIDRRHADDGPPRIGFHHGRPDCRTDESRLADSARTHDQARSRRATMTATTTAEPTTQHPGRARRDPDLRRPAQRASTEPPLFLIGSPMGAAGFATLAGHFADRTVVTYDPRGAERSTKDRSRRPSRRPRPARRRPASDHRGGRRRPVDLFASSGGAVNALALVAKHPEDVRTLVAHEPPLASVLPDREHALAAVRADPRDVPARRLGCRDGALHRRRRPPRRVPRRLRQPARAGPGDVRHADRGRRLADRRDARPEHRSPARTTSPTSTRCGRPRRGSSWPPARSPRARWRNRGAHAVAERLGTEPVIFPSDHGGFLGGEYGQTGEPDAFAAKLREVLEER